MEEVPVAASGIEVDQSQMEGFEVHAGWHLHLCWFVVAAGADGELTVRRLVAALWAERRWKRGLDEEVRMADHAVAILRRL
jgi:hypothetical protein